MPRKGEQIGFGTEKIVRQDLNHPDRVIKEYRRAPKTPELMKGRFYFGKLLHVLLPQYFPNIHRATTDPSELHMKKVDTRKSDPDLIEQRAGLTAMLREKTLAFLGLDDWKKISTQLDREIKTEAIQDLRKSLKDFEIEIWDDTDTNFELDIHRELFYVDNIDPWIWNRLNFRLARLRNAIRALPPDREQQAAHCLRQIVRLYKELRQREGVIKPEEAKEIAEYERDQSS